MVSFSSVLNTAVYRCQSQISNILWIILLLGSIFLLENTNYVESKKLYEYEFVYNLTVYESVNFLNILDE